MKNRGADNWLKYPVVVIKGACMGAADVVPGVSGGTIALLMGIYQRLIDAIHSVLPALPLLLRGRLRLFCRSIDGTFLALLFGGILLSVLSIAKLMTWLLETHPVQVWSLFFGLILASSFFVLKGVGKLRIQHLLAMVAGIAVAAAISLLSPAETPDAWWFIFLSGAIAICAMILPGISGSFILLLLGKYEFIMQAVTTMNVPVLILFAAGAVVGLLSFSQLLSWLLKQYYATTLSLLSGFMLGSLVKVWPWKEALSDGTEIPIMPFVYEEIYSIPSQYGHSLLFFFIGCVVVLIVEIITKKTVK
ncbi:MAG: DUF368 domain-containing protein [Candidatus Egerieousia sp.]